MTELTCYQLLMRARLSARYHQQRRRVLLRRAKLAQYFNVLASMGLMVTTLQDYAPLWLRIVLPFGIALFTLADTIFGFIAQAYEHASLYRRWLALEEWLLAEPDNPETCDEAHKRALRIEADEPPVHTPARDLCDNELLVAEGHDPSYVVGKLGRLSALV